MIPSELFDNTRLLWIPGPHQELQFPLPNEMFLKLNSNPTFVSLDKGSLLFIGTSFSFEKEFVF